MIIKSLFFILLFSLYVHANVKLRAPQSLVSGEALIFSIEATGSNIEFPQINSIENFAVQNKNSSNNITIINGERKESIMKQYILFPTKDITLPIFEIMINGNVFHTKEQRIVVSKPVQTINDNYYFKISSSKKSLFVGESAIVTFEFKHKKDLKIVQLSLNSPDFSGFWSKSLGKPEKIEDDSSITQILRYVVLPQKSGKLILPAVSIDLSTLDNSSNRYAFFTQPTKDEKIYSNELIFDVNALPKNIHLVGELALTESLSKKELKSGEALSFNIEIDGRGNIDDIEELKFGIPDATIYENNAEKTFDVKNNEYGGHYKKSYSIVATKSYTIPSVELQYFDLKTHTVKTLKTKEHFIKINEEEQTNAILEKQVLQDDRKIIEKKVEVNQNNNILFFLYGVIFSIICLLLVRLINKTQEKKHNSCKPISKSVKEAKNSDALVKILIPYLGMNKSLDTIVFELDKHKDLNLKVKKKEIIKIIESLEKKGQQ